MPTRTPAQPYSSNSYSPGALTTNAAPANTPTSSAFNTAFQTVNWIGYAGSSYTISAGTLSAYAGSSAPTGWLLVDGSCYSTTGSNAGLFAAIGYTYGGSGSSFCLPDLRGRFALGKAVAGTGSTLGASGGSLSPAPSLTLSGWTPHLTIPTHSFSWSVPAHTHSFSGGSGPSISICPWTQQTGTCQANYYPVVINGPTDAAGGGTETSTVNSYSANGNPISSANVSPSVAPPPYLALNYIIKN